MEFDIKTDDLKEIKSILKKYLPRETKVWIFGSRAKGKGKAKPFSDLDLALDFGRKMSLEELAVLTTEFENSLIPYKVDLVDLWAVDNSFKKIIDQEKKEFVI